MMNTTADNPALPNETTSVSLDAIFDPVTRKQWVELAVSGLNAEAGEQALQELRRTSLEGIALEVLYDKSNSDVWLTAGSSNTQQKNSQMDNRVCVQQADPDHANKLIMAALQGGSTSIELHNDSPQHIARALDKVQLDIATLSLRSGMQYEQCADSLKNLAHSDGIDIRQLVCSFNADPLGESLKRGGKDDMGMQLRSLGQFASNTTSDTPLARSVLIDSALHHNAGASTVEELHAALATATLYLESMLETGMSVSEASQQIVFQLAMDADVLLGVSKLRALQLLWRHTLQHIDDQKNTSEFEPALIVVETSRRFTSVLEPWNNHLRNLSASTAAFLGNADALIVHPHDALLRTNNDYDTELGDRMARNIPIVLERECGLSKVHDPMAGAYAIEELTRQLMQHAWQSLASTDTSEGWLDELASGRWKTRLLNTHRQRVVLMEQEQRVAIGVNRFVHTAQASSSTTTELQKHASDSQSMLPLVREAEAFEERAIQGGAS